MTRHVLALCGGVGGAKLAQGLAAVLGPEELTLVVNTGDDFEHMGLAISPDIDTVIYTLAGLADPERGWGLRDETWNFMAALKRLGAETWFNLGDQDLATHVERTRRLRAGESLSAVTADLARRLGVAPLVAPMSDQPVRTWLDTDEGPLDFQRYFVERQCRPKVRHISFKGAEVARPSVAFLEALARPDLAGLVICPSNPYLSVDPILAIPGVREALWARRAPSVAVSPLIGGAAVKGPTSKLMSELGLEPRSDTIAAHYTGLVDALLLDRSDIGDAAAVQARGVEPNLASTLMTTSDHKRTLAQACLDALAAAGSRIR